MQVLETAITSQRYSGMGTTIVASIVEGNRLSVGHVGDSRLYILANDRLRQITHDDSWMASMLAHDPSVDVTRLEHHPMRNALTNVVGSKRRTDVHVVEETLQGGELLLLTRTASTACWMRPAWNRSSSIRTTCTTRPRASSPRRSRRAAATTARRSSRAIYLNKLGNWERYVVSTLGGPYEGPREGGHYVQNC